MKNLPVLYSKAVSIKARPSIRRLGERRIYNLVGSSEFNSIRKKMAWLYVLDSPA